MKPLNKITSVKTILVLLFIFAIAGVQALKAQSTHDLLVSGGLDVIKTDNTKLFDKAQVGLEANYFLQRHFSVGAGAEFWTRQRNSFVMGVRWYPIDEVFFRFRGLIGANDAALGAGWSKALSEKWRFEAMGDFYFNQSAFGARAGLSYVIR